MVTQVTPLPQLDRNDPNFPGDVDIFFGEQLPIFTVQVNSLSGELMTARDEAVAARNETVPLANQVITLAPQAIQASNSVNILAPQVQANANQVAADKQAVTTMVAGATQIQMGGSTGYPTIGPSLIFNPAHSRMLKRRMVFTRASSATYLDQMGRLRSVASGMPVFEFSPAGRSLGVRIEPPRTNNLLYSESFETLPWVATRATISSNVAQGDDGTMTADKIVEDTSNGTHFVNQTRNLTNQPVEFVVTVAAAGRGFASLEMSNNLNEAFGVFVDLSSGAITAQPNPGGTDFTARSASVTPAGPGRWRVAIRANKGSVNNAVGCYVYPAISGVNRSYQGDGVSGVCAWGAQLSAPGASYIPTTSAAATRPADILTLPAAATVDVLNPREGAFVIEFVPSGTPAAGESWDLFEYSNGSDAERIVIRLSATSIQLALWTNGLAPAVITLGTVATVGARHRLVFIYSPGSIRATLNGAAVLSIALASPPLATWDRLSIGSARGIRVFSGHIAQLYAYPRALTDAELIALSRL